MPLVCPYCSHSLKLKSPKPGQYSAKCPGCGGAIRIVVPTEGQAVVNSVASQTKQPGAEETDPNATRAHQFTPEAARPIRDESGSDETRPGKTRPLQAAVSSVKRPAETGEEPAEKIDIPLKLGGYEVIKPLGEGGMGTVYLGRQLSLDRNVALKVMKPELASSPAFVARFTREAYAAAQLVHHNVVQIYDIGAEKDVHFYSMEYVPGRSLSAVLQGEGKLDPELAAGYLLQAARGLKFGHDLGMVHRDVKPDNLLLNTQGIVKVADLGLVKLAGESEGTKKTTEGGASSQGASVPPPGESADVTRVGSAVGTPAYMAPEQGRDAAHVDARADIYSLGCSLYVMVTGRPPFAGKTALEVLSKHATDPVVPPEAIVKRVPKELSSILLKMLAKKPEERYGDMGQVIDQLEKYLGIQTAGPFSPREEHASTLEDCVNRFNDSKMAGLRRNLMLGFFAGCALAVLLFLFVGRPLLAGGFVGLALLTPASYLLIQGFKEKNYLYLKFRELVFGSRIVDWLLWSAGIAFFLLVLYLLGLLWVWLGFCAGAALLAFGFQFAIDKQVAAERQPPIADAEKLLRSLRLNGLEEETLRRFVCKYSGKRWEEFYEALFGYEAKLLAREWDRTEAGKQREKFGVWRDPLIAWINARIQAQREAKEKKHLQAVEEKALKAQGLQAPEARRKAEQLAEALVDEATEIKKTVRLPDDNRAKLRRLVQAARAPDVSIYGFERKRSIWKPFAPLVNLVLGPTMRFLVGAALFTGCLLWIHQNRLISSQQIKESAESLKDLDVGKLKEGLADVDKLKEELAEKTQALKIPDKETLPLRLPLVPAAVTNLFNSFNSGVAGLILLFSAFYSGRKIGILLWPAALVAFVGHLLAIPAVGPLTAAQASMVIGTIMAVIGTTLLRR
jgi:serine/threonine protein kinase